MDNKNVMNNFMSIISIIQMEWKNYLETLLTKLTKMKQKIQILYFTNEIETVIKIFSLI